MKESKRKWLEVMGLILALSAFLMVFYGNVLLNPNQFIFSSEGDGLKNYYTFLYHLRHDESYIWFSGMNYPFGDLHLFADGNHPLAVLLKPISHSPLVYGNEVAWFNLYFLLTIYPCAIVLYLIFKKLGLSGVIAVLGALIISLFCPQWYRLEGHYTMAIFYALPLAMYFIQNIVAGFRIWPIVGLAVLFFTYFLFSHIYLGLISIGIFAVSGFLYLILSFGDNQKVKKLIGISVVTVLPVLFLQLYMGILNPFHDRPENPSGISLYQSNVESVFLPNSGFIKEATSGFLNYEQQVWEGYGYVGAATIVLIAFYFFALILKVTGLNERMKFVAEIPLIVRCWLITGLIFLLLSMGTFHELLGVKLTDMLGPLKQIRGLGRFSWGFYFTATVFAIYLLHSFYQTISRRFLKISLLTILIGIYSAEILAMHKLLSDRLTEPNFMNKEGFPSEKLESLHQLSLNIETSKFQCILPLPFYHIGSEYYLINNSGELFDEAQVLSFWMGLPLMSNAIGRSSLSRTKRMFQLITPPYVAKSELEVDLSTKNILVIIDKDIPVQEYEKWLLDQSEVISENEFFEMRSLNPQILTSKGRKTLPPDVSQCLKYRDMCITDSSVFFTSEKFDSLDIQLHSFSSPGAFVNDEEYGVPLSIEAGKLHSGQKYMVSFWYYNAYQEKRGFAVVQEEDEAGNLIGWTPVSDMVSTPFIYGDWSMVELPFEVHNRNHTFRLVTVENKQKKTPLIIDNVLVRPAGVDVYESFSDSLMLYNNRLVYR